MSASEFAFVRGVRVGLRGIRRQARARAPALVAIALVAAVMLGLFVAALPLSASAGPSSVAAAAPPTPSASHGAIAAFGSSVSGASGDCSNGSFNGGCIFGDIWGLFIGFFQSTASTLQSSFSLIFGAFSNGIVTMFNSWGFGLAMYNVWGPVMVVVSLGVAALAGYVIFDVIGIERDALSFEEDI